MTDAEKLVHAAHDFEKLRAKMFRALTENKALLTDARTALTKPTPSRLQIADERIDLSLQQLDQLLAHLTSLK